MDPHLPDRRAGSGERWGWEFRDARTVLPPFPEEPPALDVATPEWSGRLASRLARARAGRVVNVRLSLLCGCAAVALGMPFGPAAAVGPAVCAAGFGWRAWGRPAWLRRRADIAYRQWLATCVRRHTDLQPQVADWWQRRRDYERWAARQVEAAPQWFPIRPGTKERADVCGGSATGWRHLLAAMAGSLLDVGTRVTVLDLSQDDVTAFLRARAARAGHTTSMRTLPEQMGEVNLLSGLSGEEVAATIAEAVHAAARESSHEARNVDATVLQQVCEQLDQPCTFTRIHAALRALLRQEGPGPDSALSVEEFDRLDRLFGEATRRGAEERIFRLNAAVQRLAALGEGGSAGCLAAAAATAGCPDHAGASLFDDDAALQVVQVSDDAADLTGELLGQVLFQVMLRYLHRQPSSHDAQRLLVVAGADAVPRAHVEHLDRVARRRGVRIVLMFRHLREDAVDLLGGGEAVVFMRLGNAKEAEQAATFIGREHRLVASQFTISHSDSSSVSTSDSTSRSSGTQDSTTTGSQWSRGRSIDFGLLFASPGRTGSDSRGEQTSTTFGRSTSWTQGRTRSVQTGVSTSESVGYQRTYDYTVTPKFLQELSPTAFILVDPRDPGSPRLGDCDPAISTLPRVADSPAGGPMVLLQPTPPT